MNHWDCSCRINSMLFGDPTEPLCSRVYRQPPSQWRGVYLFVADIAFGEFQHCRNIHERWLRK